MCTISSGLVITAPFTDYAFGEGFINLSSANQIAIYPFIVPYPLKVTKITVSIITADNSNNSDIGIYDASGNLIANLGAQHFSATGVQSFTLPNGPIIIGPGQYFLAFTSAATNLQWAERSNGNTVSLTTLATSTTSSGGALPASITVTTSLGNSQLQGCPPTMVLS